MIKPASNLIFVAQVGASHGVQGEFKLLSFMDDAYGVLEYSPLLNEKGEAVLVLSKAREHKGHLLVRAESVPDKTAADRIKGLKLYIERAALPDPEDDEYYITDLIGLKVFDAAGIEVGRVLNIENFGAGDLLDIKPVEGASFYLAFTRENVPEVHMNEGRIVVDLTGA